MKRSFYICMGDKSVGTAEVQKQGLYYRIRCRCALTEASLCRVLVRCGDREESLGILIPEDGAFGLETRIPVKKIGEGALTFSAVPKHSPVEGRFVSLAPEEPFRYLTRLKEAYLVKRNGKIGIIIKEPGCV